MGNWARLALLSAMALAVSSLGQALSGEPAPASAWTPTAQEYTQLSVPSAQVPMGEGATLFLLKTETSPADQTPAAEASSEKPRLNCARRGVYLRCE